MIGVPLTAPFSIAGGLDALLSAVQMPGGIRVARATIGEAGAQNAAILAAEILGTSDPKVAEWLRARRKAGAAKVLASSSGAS